MMNVQQSNSMRSVFMPSKTCFTGKSLRAPATSCRRSGQSFRVDALFSGKKKQSNYDDSAKKVDPAQPAFTRRREAFVGRLAMFGFASALIGELSTGLGPLGQLQLELGLPPIGADLIIFGSIAYSLIGGLNPASPTFSEENQRDVRKRNKGPTQDPKINITEPKKFLGITSFGFSKKNEIFVGRTAQLGFLAAVIGEKVTGKGILQQVGIATGIPIGQQSVFLVAFIGFFLLASILEGEKDPEQDQSTY